MHFRSTLLAGALLAACAILPAAGQARPANPSVSAKHDTSGAGNDTSKNRGPSASCDSGGTAGHKPVSVSATDSTDTLHFISARCGVTSHDTIAGVAVDTPEVTRPENLPQPPKTLPPFPK
jgi:hypothetical protein